MNYRTLDDAALIGLIAQRRADALSELYDRYHRLVFSLALQIVQDQAVAEEVTLDVFIRIWEKATTYRANQAKVTTWLMTIARNQAIDMVRRQRVRPEHNSVSWAEYAPQAGHNSRVPEEQAALALRRDRVHAALAQIPPEQREVLALVYFRGYTHRQIATRLDQPVGTVKTRIRLAMQKLRRLLVDEQGMNLE